MVELITLHPKQMISNITRRMWLHNMWRGSHVTQVVVRSLRDLSSLRYSRHFVPQGKSPIFSLHAYAFPLDHTYFLFLNLMVSQPWMISQSLNWECHQYREIKWKRGDEPRKRSLHFIASFAQWHVTVTFEGSLHPDRKARANLKTRRQDLQNLCLCFDFNASAAGGDTRVRMVAIVQLLQLSVYFLL